MNDTTAFLSGCAIAAVATFVIMDKGNNRDCANRGLGSNVPSMNQTLPPTQEPPPPSVNPQQPQAHSQLQQQLTENQQLKSQLQQQRTEVEQLKSQLDKQWMETQQLLLQMQAQQGRPTAADSSLPDYRTIFLWVLGASVLVLGIGGSIIIIVVLLAMFAQSQQRYYPTAHVVHPLNVSSSPRRVSCAGQSRYLSPDTKVRGTSDLDDD